MRAFEVDKTAPPDEVAAQRETNSTTCNEPPIRKSSETASKG